MVKKNCQRILLKGTVNDVDKLSTHNNLIVYKIDESSKITWQKKVKTHQV